MEKLNIKTQKLISKSYLKFKKIRLALIVDRRVQTGQVSTMVFLFVLIAQEFTEDSVSRPLSSEVSTLIHGQLSNSKWWNWVVTKNYKSFSQGMTWTRRAKTWDIARWLAISTRSGCWQQFKELLLLKRLHFMKRADSNTKLNLMWRTTNRDLSSKSMTR